MLNNLIIEQMAQENRQLTNRAETAEMDARIAEEQIVILAQQLADAQAERDAYKAALERIRDLKSDALAVKPASSIEAVLQGTVQAQKRMAREALGGGS